MSDANWQQRIVCDPQIHHGEPVIKGTRVSVAILVGSLADMGVDELLTHYPHLTRDDVRAAVRFAAEAVSNTLVA